MRIRIWMLLCILSVTSAFAQDMKSVFVSMPDSIAPLLTKVNKEDCVDFLAYNMKAEVKNRFGGATELKVLTDDYLFLQTTANSSMEMKLLPVNDSTKVVCMIKTVCSSACDSEVHFYSSDWKEYDDIHEFFSRFPCTVSEVQESPVRSIYTNAFQE